MSAAVFEYLDSQRAAHPDLAEDYNTLEELYRRKYVDRFLTLHPSPQTSE